MEFIVEKIGMSRTVGVPSIPVTLLKVKDAKVCELKDDSKAVIAYSEGKRFNKSIEGQQKKYNLSKEFNRFAIVKVANTEAGDQNVSPLAEATKVKASFNTKGRGFSGVVKRWDFNGGPGAHGSRFHKRGGSIGMRNLPGRVQPGKKMPGHYGNELVTVGCDVVSFDADSKVLVVKGSIPGANGAMGRVKVGK